MKGQTNEFCTRIRPVAELNKIYNADVVEFLKRLPDKSIDLTVTSPPYDNIRTYTGFSWNFEETAKQLYRVTKDGGVVVWVIADQTINGSETGTSFKQALYFKSCGFNLHDTMIYAKHNPPPVGGNKRYFQSFEYMFVFSKGTPKTFNTLTEPRRNACNDKRTQRFKGFVRNQDGSVTKRLVSINQNDPKRRNIWTYMVGGGNSSASKIAFQHPAIFPEQLAEDHILSWSNEGDVVLDPFMGSGTTAVMAMKNQRNYVGCDISAEYCKIAEQRIKEFRKLNEVQ